MADVFADRLAAAVRHKKSPAIVGLDPRWDSLPKPLQQGGGSAAGRAEDISIFCRAVIDVVAPLVPAVKPQSACFEELGPAGAAVLKEVILYARSRGLLVILDGKRNDIGSTAESYAKAYLGDDSEFGADCLTINPYLGEDSVRPFVDRAARVGAGLFILVKTSNPGGGLFQDLRCDGVPLHLHVAKFVERLTCEQLGISGFGHVGAVVGATYPEQLGELRAVMPHAWILVPGYGAQGGTAKSVSGAFDARGLGGLINNSRGIIFAHSRPEFAAKFGPDQWEQAVEAATRQMIADLRSETSAGKLE